jgi:hypothetical protein
MTSTGVGVKWRMNSFERNADLIEDFCDGFASPLLPLPFLSRLKVCVRLL